MRKGTGQGLQKVDSEKADLPLGTRSGVTRRKMGLRRWSFIRALQATENLGTLKPFEGAEDRDKGFNGNRRESG